MNKVVETDDYYLVSSVSLPTPSAVRAEIEVQETVFTSRRLLVAFLKTSFCVDDGFALAFLLVVVTTLVTGQPYQSMFGA